SRGYSGVLIEGMLDKTLEIIRARGVGKNRGKIKLMKHDEMEDENALVAKGKEREWEQEKVIKPRDLPFHLGATLAAELGFARFTVPSKDVKDVSAIYGVSEVKDPEPGWVDKFASIIRKDWVTVILVTVGFIGLILELKVPGTTIPGIIAALCFILVFWAHSKYDTIFVLAIALFIMGLVLLALEIFVLPGFGVCGISGILLILAGVGGGALVEMPSTREE